MKTTRCGHQTRLIAAVILLAINTAGQVMGQRISTGLDTAPAPAPASANKTLTVANLLIIISAEKARFVTPNYLQIEGLADSMQFFSESARTGIMGPQHLLNSSMGSQYKNIMGQWLNAPDAVLYGMAGGKYHNLLLTLDGPTYNKTTNIATFNVSVINPNVSELHLSNGVANQVAADYNSDTGLDTLITGVQPGNEFTEVALLIDVNKDSLDRMSQERAWNIGTGGWSLGFGNFGVQCSWGFNCNLSWG